MTAKHNRRCFVEISTFAFLTAASDRKVSDANERINIGCIGFNKMFYYNRDQDALLTRS